MWWGTSGVFSWLNWRRHSHSRLVFQPLEDVVRNLRSVLMSELGCTLTTCFYFKIAIVTVMWCTMLLILIFTTHDEFFFFKQKIPSRQIPLLSTKKYKNVVESLEFSHMVMATSLYLCIYASLIKRLCVSILRIVFPEIYGYQYSRICCLINIHVGDTNVNKAADTWILVYFWKNDSQYRHA